MNAMYPVNTTGFRPTRSDKIPAGNACAAYTMLYTTYSRMATVVPWIPARSRRNAYEKSANEKRLAIPMNVQSGFGIPRKVTRRGCFGVRWRTGSRTRQAMKTEITGGGGGEGRGKGRLRGGAASAVCRGRRSEAGEARRPLDVAIRAGA